MIGQPHPVAVVRHQLPERHEKLTAHAFEALELGKRFGMIVDPKIEVWPFLLTADDERSRLLAALVATGCLARPHRGDQAPWKGERGTAVISRARVLDHSRPGEH